MSKVLGSFIILLARGHAVGIGDSDNFSTVAKGTTAKGNDEASVEVSYISQNLQYLGPVRVRLHANAGANYKDAKR